MRSSAVAINLILSSVLAAAVPARAVLKRVEALPLSQRWTQAIVGPAPVASAAEPTRLVAGWADHFDVFALATGEREWGLPVPAPRVACDTGFCVVADAATVRGIDLDRHAVKWQAEIDTPLDATPTLRNGWVILAFQSGDLRALQGSDGREVWRFHAGGAIIGAPSIDGAHLAIATAEPAVTLLDLPTGRVRWTTALTALPKAPRLGGGTVILGTENGRLLSLNDRNGHPKFEYRVGANVTGTPTLDETHIYAVGQDGVLRAFDRGNGAQRWYVNLDTRAAAGPEVDGDLVFVPLRTGAIEVQLADGQTAAHLPAPGSDGTGRLASPPVFAGTGAGFRVITLSYDLTDTSTWSIAAYGNTRLSTSALPAKIPGLALTLTAPR